MPCVPAVYKRTFGVILKRVKMNFNKHRSDAVHWYMHDLACRVVAKSGIATDRYHAGKLILQSLKEAPNLILQIDGATGESETFQSALERSVRCATAFRNIGLKLNDVIIIMAPLNIDLTTSMYAAFYLGVGVAGVDTLLGVEELQDTIQICLPKMIFCQSEKVAAVGEALKDLKLDVRVVTYDKGNTYCSFSEFLHKYGDNTPVDDFQPASIDTEEAISVLLSTSGTTGLPKYAALTHKNLMIGLPYLWIRCHEFPTPTRMALTLSPVQWISATNSLVMSPILKFTRLQTSLPVTTDHTYYLINKYKPTFVMTNPSMMTTLIKPGQREKCDFTSFRLFLLAGSPLPQKLFEDLKIVAPYADVYAGYGMSEIGTIALDPVNFISGCAGRPLGNTDYRLVDPGTGKDVLEPHKTGELWFKGPITFKGYYNNPEMTAEIYTEDKWLKSGDLFYRDENWNFFFVDRVKLLLKYRSHQISPTEIEDVIRTHPGVYDVAVTGILDEECNELPVACVVLQDSHTLTAQEIKDLVKSTLTDSNQLRGGVIFTKELPLTSTSKINRTALKSMVNNMKRE
ncbi:unnamed protein product [Parnassius apollo]|uniref:(apollo) hypothetical protein n=1 Tax=Parnassius apollo TaxID=110799 RepID=A0A8S3XGG3_PARAO|nr:unnamed protein product [Parnassius apollo]